MRFSKPLIVLIIVLNVVFTCAIIFLFYKTESEPVVLTTAWFAFTGTELWNMASIKKHKIKRKETGDDKEDCN